MLYNLFINKNKNMLKGYSKSWADFRAIKQQEKWAKGIVTFFAGFTVFVIFYALIKTIIQL